MSGGVHLQKNCRSQVFRFTKDRPHLEVLLVILKIFRTAISLAPAASYCHYYVMPWPFLLITRVFNFYLFPWQQSEMTFDCLFNNISSGSSTISNFLCKHKLHLLELGFYDLSLRFILQDIRG